MKKYFVQLKGGLGLNVSFARVATILMKRGCDITVLTPYWDLFASTPIPYYKPDEIRDFIFDAKYQNAEIITTRIYDMSCFIYKEINYKDAWLKLLGLDKTETITDEEYNKLELSPESAFPRLKQDLEDSLNRIKDAHYDDFILVQFCGGQPAVDTPPDGDWNKKEYDCRNEPLKRYYPTEKAQQFVNLYKAAHPHTAVVQYCLPNEPILSGVIHLRFPYLVYYSLSFYAKQAVVIDSSLQHLVSGNCPVTVIWGHTLPNSFGYSCNNNIVQECRRDDILYFTELGASSAHINYISPEELLKQVDEQYNNYII